MNVLLVAGLGVSLLRARHTPDAVLGSGFAACTPERRARHTPHATRSIVTNCGTCARSASIVYITSGLYLCSFPLCALASELALQADARSIVEKWPVEIQAYDCTFRQQDAHIWLSKRLQGTLARLFGDRPLLIHKYGVAVARSHVERQCAHNTLQKASGRLPCCTWLALLGCRDTHNSLQKRSGRLPCCTWLASLGRSIHKTYPTKKVQVQAAFEERRTAWARTHTQYSSKKPSVRDRVGFVSPARFVTTHMLIKTERFDGLRGARQVYRTPLDTYSLLFVLFDWLLACLDGLFWSWSMWYGERISMVKIQGFSLLNGTVSEPYHSFYICSLFGFLSLNCSPVSLSSYIFAPGSLRLFLCSSVFSSGLSGLFCVSLRDALMLVL